MKDITQNQSQYIYSGHKTDSGRIVTALGDQATQYTVYIPLSKELINKGIPAQTVQDCPYGKACFKVQQNGDIIVYRYSYKLDSNPYEALAQQSLYSPDPYHPGKYALLQEIRYSYNLSGELERESIGKKVVTNHYDALGNLIKSSTSSDNTVKQNDYIYDANDNLTVRQSNKTSIRLSINGIGEAITTNSQQISYDGNGNQLSHIAPNGLGSRLLVIGHYLFNARNQLVGYHPSSGQLIDYAYTANGLRWSQRAEGSGRQLHYYNQGSQVLNVVEANPQTQNSIVITHYLLGKERISRLLTQGKSTSGSIFYYLNDYNGNVLGHLVFDQIGQNRLCKAKRYSPYGIILNKISSQQVNAFDLKRDDGFGYHGEQQNTTTGLTYLHARYYDSYMARFISQDNYRLMNRYMSFHGDPMNRVDPNGHLSKSLTTILSGLVIGLSLLTVAEGGLIVSNTNLLTNTLLVKSSGISLILSGFTGIIASGFNLGGQVKVSKALSYVSIISGMLSIGTAYKAALISKRVMLVSEALTSFFTGGQLWKNFSPKSWFSTVPSEDLTLAMALTFAISGAYSSYRTFLNNMIRSSDIELQNLGSEIDANTAPSTPRDQETTMRSSDYSGNTRILARARDTSPEIVQTVAPHPADRHFLRVSMNMPDGNAYQTVPNDDNT